MPLKNGVHIRQNLTKKYGDPGTSPITSAHTPKFCYTKIAISQKLNNINIQCLVSNWLQLSDLVQICTEIHRFNMKTLIKKFHLLSFKIIVNFSQIFEVAASRDVQNL